MNHQLSVCKLVRQSIKTEQSDTAVPNQWVAKRRNKRVSGFRNSPISQCLISVGENPRCLKTLEPSQHTGPTHGLDSRDDPALTCWVTFAVFVITMKTSVTNTLSFHDERAETLGETRQLTFGVLKILLNFVFSARHAAHREQGNGT